MATQIPQTIPLKAGADLSAKQYHFVEVTGVRTVGAANAVTDKAIGVLQNDPNAAGAEATVAIGGTTKLVAGGSITAGALVAPKADGRGQTAVATQYARAIALETSVNDGDIIEVALIPLTVMA
jgi:hypothetical protein